MYIEDICYPKCSEKSHCWQWMLRNLKFPQPGLLTAPRLLGDLLSHRLSERPADKIILQYRSNHANIVPRNNPV